MSGASGSVPDDVLEALKAAGGPGSWLAGPGDLEPYLSDSRGLFHGDAALVLRPGDTQQVAALVKLAAEAGICVYPAGGRTGLAGGRCSVGGPQRRPLSAWNG